MFRQESCLFNSFGRLMVHTWKFKQKVLSFKNCEVNEASFFVSKKWDAAIAESLLLWESHSRISDSAATQHTWEIFWSLISTEFAWLVYSATQRYHKCDMNHKKGISVNSKGNRWFHPPSVSCETTFATWAYAFPVSYKPIQQNLP